MRFSCHDSVSRQYRPSDARLMPAYGYGMFCPWGQEAKAGIADIRGHPIARYLTAWRRRKRKDAAAAALAARPRRRNAGVSWCAPEVEPPRDAIFVSRLVQAVARGQ